MSKILSLALRGFQFLWTFLIMALIGNAIASRDANTPSATNYVMFTAAFSMLTLLYTIPASFHDGLQGHPIIPTVLDGLNTLFTFVAGIVLAAKLGAHSCDNYGYTSTTGVINYTIDHQVKVCRESQASTAFLWFLFATYVASLAFSAMGMKGGASMRGGAGGIRRGPPAMSQV